MKEIYALGVGHNTPVMIDLAEACGYNVVGLYHYDDSRTGEMDHGFEIIGSFEDLLAGDSLIGKFFLLTMGDSNIRKDLSEKIVSLGGEIPTLIHPTAVVSQFSVISEIGVYVFPYVSIEAEVTIGRNTSLLTNSVISHNTVIGDNNFISAGVIIGAYTSLGHDVFVGQGALIISGKVAEIGDCSYIAARTLVTKNVPKNVLAIGAPCVFKEKKSLL